MVSNFTINLTFLQVTFFFRELILKCTLYFKLSHSSLLTWFMCTLVSEMQKLHIYLTAVYAIS